MFDCLSGALRDKKWNQPSDNSKNPQNLHKLGRNWDKFLSPAEILVNDNDRSALVFLRNTVFGLITIMKKLLEIHFYLKILIWSWHTARYDKQKFDSAEKYSAITDWKNEVIYYVETNYWCTVTIWNEIVFLEEKISPRE